MLLIFVARFMSEPDGFTPHWPVPDVKWSVCDYIWSVSGGVCLYLTIFALSRTSNGLLRTVFGLSRTSNGLSGTVFGLSQTLFIYV